MLGEGIVYKIHEYNKGVFNCLLKNKFTILWYFNVRNRIGHNAIWSIGINHFNSANFDSLITVQGFHPSMKFSCQWKQHCLLLKGEGYNVGATTRWWRSDLQTGINIMKAVKMTACDAECGRD